MRGYPSSCWLPGIKPRDHWCDACQHGVREGASPALLPDVWSSPRQGTVDDRLYSRPCRTTHDIHHFERQHLKAASDRMKARYDQLANSACFQEGDRVRLYRPTRKRRKSPVLQTCWEGPYNIITRINDVIYWIQRHPRAKMMVVHLDRLAPYLGTTRNE